MEEEAELTIEAPRAEPFDKQKHSLLNEELKMFCDRPSATDLRPPPTPAG